MLSFAADPEDRQQALEHTFEAITNQQPVAPATVTVQMGRKLQVDKAGGILLALSLKSGPHNAGRSRSYFQSSIELT